MGWTVLHTAARDGDMKRIKRCIEDVKWLNKMDINGQTDQRGHTPLHMCAANGHVEMMQYIMSRDGVKKDVQTQQGNTPLHLAAINSKEKACKVLLSNGFDIRICNSNGKTAADVAPDESLRSFLTKQLESVKGRGNRQDSYDDEDEV